ncbi:MAG TPA: hypothetical protein VHS53_02260, partial [Mucilaginibacter sp.]|nr:hypothetical protein [Mucilaginibacter sp.]
KLKESIANLLEQVAYLLSQLNNEQYTQPVKVLSRSSIGQHTRHVLEYFIELDKGYGNGLLDYDKRIRSLPLESDLVSATVIIQEIIAGLEKPDKKMLLSAEYGEGKESSLEVITTYNRELVYNLEHLVHHMALIRIGVEATTDVVIPAGFGVGASTLKYRRACAQ